MTKPNMGDRHEEEIIRLRTQNRRYRELIQNLSSVVEIVRHRLENLQPSSSEHRAFERIDGEKEPPVIAHTRTSGAKSTLLRLFRSSQHQAPDDLRPLAPNPGWKCLALDRPKFRIGFTLFGMTTDAVEEAVDEVEHRQVRTRDFTPVFVTDSPDLGPFRVRGYVVEYVPVSITSKARGSRDERHDLNDRIELIEAKWGLGKVVDLGRGRS